MALRNSNMSGVQFGLCRFCNEMKKCRIVNQEYMHMGQKEIYTDMLMETFGLLLINLDSDAKERLVCAMCVVRLRSGCAFKRQVLQCEERLLNKLRLQSIDHSPKIVKIEDAHTLDTEFHLDDSQLDDSQIEDSLMGDSQIDHSQIEGSPNERSHLDESYYAVEVLDESLLGSDEEDTKTTQEIEIKVELESEPKTSRPLRQAAKKPRLPSEPSEPSEASETSDDDTPISEMKRGLAYRNNPTKKVMALRMKKLRALMAASTKKVKPIKPPKSPMHIYKPSESKQKEIHKQANTVTVVENSYVTPFNNIAGNYYCYYCRSIFTDPAMLREHNVTHNPKPYFLRNWCQRRAPKLDITRIDCRLCDANIDNIPDLKEHLTTIHKKKFHDVTNEFLVFKLTHPELFCMECSEKFFFIDKLIDHMAEHFGNYICEQCGAAFVQQGSLEAHVRCHNRPKMSFPCHVCGKSMTTNRSRKMHLATVHDKQNLIECYKCDERFLNYHKRNKHMEEAHGYVRTIPCPQCDRAFENRKMFLTHLESKHSLNNGVYQCEECDKKFLALLYLKRHVRSYHNSNKKKV